MSIGESVYDALGLDSSNTWEDKFEKYINPHDRDYNELEDMMKMDVMKDVNININDIPFLGKGKRTIPPDEREEIYEKLTKFANGRQRYGVFAWISLVAIVICVVMLILYIFVSQSDIVMVFLIISGAASLASFAPLFLNYRSNANVYPDILELFEEQLKQNDPYGICKVILLLTLHRRIIRNIRSSNELKDFTEIMQKYPGQAKEDHNNLLNSMKNKN